MNQEKLHYLRLGLLHRLELDRSSPLLGHGDDVAVIMELFEQSVADASRRAASNPETTDDEIERRIINLERELAARRASSEALLRDFEISRQFKDQWEILRLGLEHDLGRISTSHPHAHDAYQHIASWMDSRLSVVGIYGRSEQPAQALAGHSAITAQQIELITVWLQNAILDFGNTDNVELSPYNTREALMNAGFVLYDDQPTASPVDLDDDEGDDDYFDEYDDDEDEYEPRNEVERELIRELGTGGIIAENNGPA